MELATISAGAGGRPLVLLHGLAGSGDDLADRLEPLARRGWHVVAPDLRGHGRSPRPDDESAYALGALAADVLELADSFGWERFALFGHEAGGVVAQEVALAASEWLDGLVLQSTCTGPLPVDRNLAEGGIELVRGTGSMDGLARIERRPLNCAPAAYASIFTRLLDAPDRSLRLAELDVPTIVVVGRDDAIFLEASIDLAATIPRSDLAVLPDCGRWPHLECPDEWLVLVAGFLQVSVP